MPLSALGSCSTLLKAEEEAPFVPLFNGHNLEGWEVVNGAASTWTACDNMIVCDGQPSGFLRTQRMYRNFIVEFEYRHMQSGGNAGFFVWADPLPARGVPFPRAIEVQVIDGWETANWTSHGDVFSIHGAYLHPDRPHPARWQRCLPSERRALGAGQWNHFRITAIDGKLKLAVNGKEVSGGYDIRPRMGYLCLEAEGSEVHFRNLHIKELPAEKRLPDNLIAGKARGFTTLYNGINFTHWQQPVADGWSSRGWILAANSPLQPLRSEQSFEDFECILDWHYPDSAAATPAKLVLRDGVEIPLAMDEGWNRLHVILVGNRLTLLQNGELQKRGVRVASSSGPYPISLQADGAQVEFANLFLRSL